MTLCQNPLYISTRQRQVPEEEAERRLVPPCNNVWSGSRNSQTNRAIGGMTASATQRTATGATRSAASAEVTTVGPTGPALNTTRQRSRTTSPPVAPWAVARSHPHQAPHPLGWSNRPRSVSLLNGTDTRSATCPKWCRVRTSCPQSYNTALWSTGGRTLSHGPLGPRFGLKHYGG